MGASDGKRKKKLGAGVWERGIGVWRRKGKKRDRGVWECINLCGVFIKRGGVSNQILSC